mgnify:CR=1 FL=1
MRCILKMNISLFLERILSFPSNNGNISKRFFHPVPFWQQCGMIKILLICSVRFSIWKRITRQRSNFLQAPLLEISSTTIRNRAAQKRSIRYMVPDSVADYIQKLQLYTKREEERS